MQAPERKRVRKHSKVRANARRPYGKRDQPGLAARQLAGSLIEAVLCRKESLDGALLVSLSKPKFTELPQRDRAFARLMTATSLRYERALREVLDTYLQKPLDPQEPGLAPVLLIGACQILILKTPPHAAINLAVEHCRARRITRRFEKLANAVLRRVAKDGVDKFSELDLERLALPEWLWNRWVKTYGEEKTRAMISAALVTPPIDLSVKSNSKAWAERLDGIELPTGTVRLAGGGRIEDIDGYQDGSWWVQDAAAAMPPLLLGDVRGKSVLDLCAAPGGKTAFLANAGARVTALDLSSKRLQKLRENMQRLDLDASYVCADAASWTVKDGMKFDAVLVDAPCTATGTIRRHPDIPHLKRSEDIAKLAKLQSAILENATRLIKSGGRIVYCTCSLEPEEGENLITTFLEKHPNFVRVPISSDVDQGFAAEWCTHDGDLRTLPSHCPSTKPELSGLDGFFAARLIQR